MEQGVFFGGLYINEIINHTKENTSSTANLKQDNPKQTDIDRAGLPDFAERIASAPDPKNADERENRDLAAQEASALWSFWMLVAATISAFITLIGATLLFWQIKLTREAVRETGRATDTMREANRITAASQRPWLTLEVVPKLINVTENGYGIFVDVVTKNVGQIAASDYAIVCHIFRVDRSLHDDPDKRFDKVYDFWKDSFLSHEIAPQVLAPTQEHHQEHLEIGFTQKDIFSDSLSGPGFLGALFAISCQYKSTLNGSVHRYQAIYSLHHKGENGAVRGIITTEIPIKAKSMTARLVFNGLID